MTTVDLLVSLSFLFFHFNFYSDTSYCMNGTESARNDRYSCYSWKFIIRRNNYLFYVHLKAVTSVTDYFNTFILD